MELGPKPSTPRVPPRQSRAGKGRGSGVRPTTRIARGGPGSRACGTGGSGASLGKAVGLGVRHPQARCETLSSPCTSLPMSNGDKPRTLPPWFQNPPGILPQRENPSILPAAFLHPWRPTGADSRVQAPALTPFGRFFTISRDMAHARSHCFDSNPDRRRLPPTTHAAALGAAIFSKPESSHVVQAEARPLRKWAWPNESNPRKSHPQGAGLSACSLRRRGL